VVCAKKGRLVSKSFVTGENRRWCGLTVACLLPLFFAAAHFSPAPALAAPTPDRPTFEADVLPIFQARCLVCHSEGAPQKGLLLGTRVALLRGGESGPAIQPGRSGKSLLMDKIAGQQMPPMDPKLTPEEVDTIRRWIDQGAPSEKDDAGPVITEQDVLPIFQVRCVACHGKREQKGGLDLRTLASRLKGGKSGPAVVPGKPEESLIIQKLEAGNMPPAGLQKEYFVRTPTDGEVQTLRAWIAGGCLPAPEHADAPQSTPVSEKDRQHWAFQPPQRPKPPKVEHRDLVRNPIDTFLLRKLEDKGLSYSAEAEPVTLLRRAYLDLTGMPPPPGEILAYLNDKSTDRYERLVDRLLDSPDYGERWARHWLDLAGYKETEGYGEGAPARKFAWRFRDYVIRAFNSDKPYNQFLTEQIAGDEMADYSKQEVTPELVERLAATGFLRTAADPTWEAEFAFIDERMNVIGDQVQILGSSLMGLTIGCAKCHDHKYDPIPQRDYYRMTAILQSSYDPYHWLQPKGRMLDIATESEKKRAAEHNAPLEQEIKGLEQSLEKHAAPFREKLLEQRLANLPEEVRRDLRALANTAESERTEVQKYLAEKFEETLDIEAEDLAEEFAEFRTIGEPVLKQLQAKRRELLPKPEVRALLDDKGEPPTSYLLRRGNPLSPGGPVEPGVPSVLTVGLKAYDVQKPWPGAETTGRRLALARWLTQPNHPLTARVIVNQLWLRHFGRGIVATPDNFGRAGQSPSHPELLDWLATDFVDNGWSLKRMHRLMVTSGAYRQSSRRDSNLSSADPENALLGRMAMRRMDAEQVYDTLLTATGRLDPERFGPPQETEVLETKEVVAKGSKSGLRRAIYVFQRPTETPTLLEAYDFPEMSPNCLMRRQSNVPTQALQMMNSDQIWEFARYMAGRIIDEAGPDRGRQVEQVFLRALSRPPTASETRESLAALEQLVGKWPERLKQDRQDAPIEPTANWLSLAGLCHTVINSAEFLFID
jgi:mono/diheme cytochrome c family protein